MMQASISFLFKLLAIFSIFLLASTHPTAHSSNQLQSRATVCNGDSSLCERLYSNVTYIGTHNSYGIAPTSNSAANQEQSITTQLNDGVRLLQVQAHKSSNSSVSGAGIDLCHTSCSLFQGGSLEYYLGQVKSWVDDNPNEVLTILIVNSDGLEPSQFAQAYTSTGLDAKSFSPADASQTSRYNWPTLGSIIDGGKNVITFITNTEADSTYTYLLPEFSYIWENPYDQTSVPFSCSVDRIGTGLDSGNLMFLSNHFLDIQTSLLGISFLTPDVSQLDTTNSAESIQSGCPNPTFVMVDFYDYGSVFQAAAAVSRTGGSDKHLFPNPDLSSLNLSITTDLQMNGIQYTAKPIGNATTGSSGSSGASSDSSSALSTFSSTSRSPVLLAGLTLLGAVCLL